MKALIEELEPGPSQLYEEIFTDKRGLTWTKILNRKQRYFFQGVPGARDEDFANTLENDINHLFSAKPTSNLTRIFSLRVFLGKSYAEISEVVGVSVPLVRGYFHTSRQRVLRFLASLSQFRDAAAWAKKAPLTGDQKLFILHKILRLSYREIEKIQKITPEHKTFHNLMNRYQKQYIHEYVEANPQEPT